MLPSLRSPLVALAALALLAATAGLTAVTAHDPAVPAPSTGRAEPPGGGPCEALPVQVRVAPGIGGCSHGPDEAPPGIDISVRPTIRQLRDRAALAAGSAATIGAGGTVLEAAAGAVPCIGTGSSGKRLEAIYAYWVGDTSRYAEVASVIRTLAAAADTMYDDSAAQTGGSRHLRWLHDDACQPIVHEIALSTAAATDFDSMVDELYAAGFVRVDRKYVVWVDVSGVYCGIAMANHDENPGPDNIHNGVAAAGLGLFARIDAPCWGLPAPDTPVEVHEIAHTLGAVQPHSPNSSSVVQPDGTVLPGDFYGHCIDEYDPMCYADGTPKPLTSVCGVAHQRLLDCSNDDYFHTDPAAGTYLDTNWNIADSAFLVTVDPAWGFADVDVADPFAADIGWLAASGITTGCSANRERFCPDGTVTREQMAAFLDRSLALGPTLIDFFTDDETSIFEAEINRLAASGITRGCSPTEFCPTATITREQMAAFLVRALSLAPTTTDYFSDDEASPFESEINRLAAAGITTGCGGGRFCPLGVVTREQMAAFLHRALE